ncbi:MAG: thiol reductase thioredoxin [Flavobacteriaceae bacterium]|nr:thiol reductase thioredoxin [Flavobacteriaceae bacterium]
MKLATHFIILILLVACGSPNNKETVANTEETAQIKKDSLNKLVEDEIDGGQMLIGEIDKEGLQHDLFESWFQPDTAAHLSDTAVVKKLAPLLEDVRIKAFMGTWCEDSQREIPTLYNILATSNYNMENFTLYAVDHDKETPQDFEEGLEIEYVPTIIFYRNDKEIGRFVEYAQQSLADDMHAILSGEAYSHPYAE